jgi:hypothetical protein
MAGSSSKDVSSGSAAPTFHLTPSTSVSDLLDAMKRQGITDLNDFAKKLIAQVRKKAGEEQGEEDEPWAKEMLIHEHYFMTHSGATLEQ